MKKIISFFIRIFLRFSYLRDFTFNIATCCGSPYYARSLGTQGRYKEINYNMPLLNNETIRCISCHHHCVLNSSPTIKTVKCVENRYSVWPEGNSYLLLGIKNLILNSHYNFSQEGFVFIDFSSHNIRYFTNDKWIRNLSKTSLQLILITDKQMEPLAFYWKKKTHLITSIITSTDDYSKIDKKINFCFTGSHDYSSSQTKLGELEVVVLDLLLAEKSVKEISQTLDVDEKKVYYAKSILQKKMGGRGKLNTAISS